MAFDEAQLILFSLILMRMTGLILLNPIFGRRGIPKYFQSGFALFLTFMVYAFYQGTEIEVANSIQYGLLLLKEFAVGYVLGYIMELFFLVITFAGAVVDFQMGLSMSTIYDPQSNAQQPLSGGIWNAYMILMFFAVNGHLALTNILFTSYAAVPVGMVSFSTAMVQAILDIFVQAIVLAMQFSFPIIAIEFLVEVAVGILMKTIPQINVFVVNIQAKILIGLGMLVFLFSPMSEFVKNLIPMMMQSVRDIIRLL